MLVADVSMLLSAAMAVDGEAPTLTPAQAEAKVTPEFGRLKTRLREHIVEQTASQPTRAIVASVAIARFHHWSPSDNGLEMGSAMVVGWRRYYTTVGSQSYRRGTMLGDRVGAALQAVMPNVPVRWEE